MKIDYVINKMISDISLACIDLDLKGIKRKKK